MERSILSFSEFKDYTGFGSARIRKLISDKRCNFSFKGGKKWYIVKEKFDEYMKFCSENNLNIDSGYDKINT